MISVCYNLVTNFPAFFILASIVKNFPFLLLEVPMRYDRLGIQFDYPENWTIDSSDIENRKATVTIYSPDGGFWSVSAHATGHPASKLCEAVLSQMREEYQDLDSEPAEETINSHRLTGFDLNFYCLDLTNTAIVRTLETPAATFLLFCQAEDREWECVSKVFAAMTASFIGKLPASIKS